MSAFLLFEGELGLHPKSDRIMNYLEKLTATEFYLHPLSHPQAVVQVEAIP